MDPTAELRALAHTLVEQLDEAMPLFETIAAEIENDQIAIRRDDLVDWVAAKIMLIRTITELRDLRQLGLERRRVEAERIVRDSPPIYGVGRRGGRYVA